LVSTPFLPVVLERQPSSPVIWVVLVAVAVPTTTSLAALGSLALVIAAALASASVTREVVAGEAVLVVTARTAIVLLSLAGMVVLAQHHPSRVLPLPTLAAAVLELLVVAPLERVVPVVERTA
jgi:hypothetical protein